jgi:hypothetical protein
LDQAVKQRSGRASRSLSMSGRSDLGRAQLNVEASYFGLISFHDRRDGLGWHPIGDRLYEVRNFLLETGSRSAAAADREVLVALTSRSIALEVGELARVVS